MEFLLHPLIHAAKDCLKMLPFLYLAYLLIEYVEHYQSSRLQKMLCSSNRFGFAVGSVLGLVPQCGFSAMAADLYSGRVITAGTLMAVFLSTSDEALPLMLAGGDLRAMVPLLAGKLLMGLVFGFLLDKLIAGKGWGGFTGRTADCDCHDHRENENIFLAALRHTLHIWLLVFILSYVLGLVMHLVGEELLAGMLGGLGFWQIPLAGLVGLIPNCAASVLLMQLYTDGLLSFAALFTGLCSGAGVGLIVLWRTNPNKKENLKLTGILYGFALIGGLLAQLAA